MRHKAKYELYTLQKFLKSKNWEFFNILVGLIRVEKKINNVKQFFIIPSLVDIPNFEYHMKVSWDNIKIFEKKIKLGNENI